jgi:regulator of protease activity HflC (stomatin/prohibitin superfamily)
MQRAMARQAEAERERRAKVIHAEGEFQAAQRLADAGRIMATQPSALQLRFLQTLTEVATERNSTIVFPVPIDLIQMFLGRGQPAPAAGGGGDGGTPPSAPQPPATDGGS